MDAERALLDLLGFRVELGRPVGTGVDTVLAPDTLILIDQDNPVFSTLEDGIVWLEGSLTSDHKKPDKPGPHNDYRR